ncbi:MAG: hypothetical protein ACK4LQ_12375 [Pararhodobacter sp.]
METIFRGLTRVSRVSDDHRRRPGAWRLVLSGLAAVAVLSSCAPSDGDRFATGIYRVANSQRNPGIQALEHTTEFRVTPATRAMVHAPEALMVLERSLGRAVDQRIVLPNATAVRGDNLLLLRAQTDDSMRLSEFNFAEVSARFGGLPAPFERLSENAMMSGQDALGSYVFASQAIGNGTTCVLLMRRLGVGARPLPRGTQALDVVMRNCVVGDMAQALAPAGERALAISGAAPGALRTISPHAAPGG